jgi:hypothetical protein
MVRSVVTVTTDKETNHHDLTTEEEPVVALIPNERLEHVSTEPRTAQPEERPSAGRRLIRERKKQRKCHRENYS